MGIGVDAAKESQEFTLAVLDHPLMVTPDQKAIQEWTNVNKPAACAAGLVFIPLIVGPTTPPHLLQAAGDESFLAEEFLCFFQSLVRRRQNYVRRYDFVIR